MGSEQLVQVTLAAYAAETPTRETFAVVSSARPTPGPGEVLCRTRYLSLDPYVRLSMLPPDSNVPRGGAAPLPLGSVISGRGVSEVVESNRPDFVPGDLVAGETGWQSHSVSDGSQLRRLPAGVSPTAALGVLGMPGFTAWSGLRFIGRPQSGDTVSVSAASGAVGSLVVQLAKHRGCRVIGFAGSPEKCRWVEQELGADVCLDHRSSTLRDDFSDLQARVDVYFDNTGGQPLAAVTPHLTNGARVVVCGRIAHLNADAGGGRAADALAEFLGMILTRQLTVTGFGWTQFAEHWDAFEAEVVDAVRTGTIAHREDVVGGGLEVVPETYSRLFRGENFGKLVVEL
ncbi:MAG: NADP-dependent oxidoreductase [Acidimicrobiia bacterium]